MKHIYLFIVLMFSTCMLWAEQMPNGYYSTAEGKQDAELKTALSKIISGGSRCKYGSRGVNEVHSSYYMWDAFLLTDRKADGTIFDMYSSLTHYFPTDSLGSVSANGVDLEHGFPKSWWGAANSSADQKNPAYVDLHHLMPAESKANSTGKSNYCPGMVDSLVVYENGVFKSGWMKGHPNNRVWEPADEYKGDFARAYFYVVTAYEDYHWIDTLVINKNGTISYGTTKGSYFCLTNESYLEFQPWMQELLLKWHREDPVSRKEIVRHDVVSNIQHNRNPYIDYPELVEYIWGNKQGQKASFSGLLNTAGADYKVPADTVNIEALPAKPEDEHSFTARWADAGAKTYSLDVYTLTQTAKADTLFALPWISNALISKTENISWDGTSSTSSGAAAVNMGVKSKGTIFTITLDNLNIGNQARLVVRANVPTGDEADMAVLADGKKIANTELVWSEAYYSFELPSGTKQIQITAGDKQKVFTIGQIFVIQNEDKIERESLEGYPLNVNATEYLVDNIAEDFEGVVYYDVQPENRQVSNKVMVQVKKKAKDAINEVRTKTWYVYQSGAFVAVENCSEAKQARLYDALGQLVDACESERPAFVLPQHGVYIVRIDNETQKIVW